MRASTWTWGAVAVVAALAAVPACVPTVKCTPENCTGCCDEAELCHAGDEVAFCGKAGSACISCAPSTTCNTNGTCFAAGTPYDGGDPDTVLLFDGGGQRDAGVPDGGDVDGGEMDAAVPDAGERDAGAMDAGDVDAGPPDAGPPDAGAPDAGAPDAGFPPMDTCLPATTLIDNSGNDFTNQVHAASAPGSPLTLLYAQGVSGQSTFTCRARAIGPTGWTPPTVLSTDCFGPMPRQVAAGGGGGLVAWADRPAGVTGKRKRTDGLTFVDVGPAVDDVDPMYSRVALGAAGHGVEVWRSNAGVGTALMNPDGGFSALPDNVLPTFIPALATVIDSAGDGFVVWIDGNASTVYARAFRSGAWAGAAAPLAAGGTLSSDLDMALLPGGDAYVVWNNSNGTLNLRGATLHFDSSTTTTQWSTPDELASGLVFRARVLAHADGELTVLWVSNNGSGVFTMQARRRLAGTFGAPVALGNHSSTHVPAVIDASGHVTVGLNPGSGSIFHRRIQRGSASWLPAVRVDQPSGTGTSGAYDLTLAVEPFTGNLLFGWVAANDLLVTQCY